MILPHQWTLAQLGDLTSRIIGGGTPSKTLSVNFNGTIPFMTVKDMKSRYVETTVDHISESALSSSSTTMVPADTLIVATRMSLGKVARPKLDVAINQDLKALFLKEEVDRTYIEYFWRSQSRTIQAMGTGTTVKGIRLEDIRSLKVPLAPQKEQKRIADKLDCVLTRVDAVNTRLARLAPILKRFRQSVLAAATSGRLTEEWRATVLSQSAAIELESYMASRAKSEKKPPAQPDKTHWRKVVPDSWVVASVHQFAECLDRLRVPIKRDDRQSEKGLYPYYGANGEVSRIDQYIFDDELVLVTEDETFYGREKPIAYRSSGKCWVNNHAHVLRAASKEANDYLCYALMYYDVIPWLSGTTGRAKLTQQALNSLPIAVPPKKEITEIVRRVEILFAFAERLEAHLQTALTATGRLTPALLARAFRGELMPQDPNDEPASELLRRLQQEAPSIRTKRGRNSAA